MNLIFWGPWLITVVPVFPVTWVIDAMLNPQLEISIQGEMVQKHFQKENVAVVAKLRTGKSISGVAESIKMNDHATYARFPIQANRVESFTLTITGATNPEIKIKVNFIKTSRWAWSQWSPNC